jgi:hypothetical protein
MRRCSTVRNTARSTANSNRRPASSSSLCESQKEDLARLRLPTTLPASPYQQAVAAFDRNRWPLSIGLGGRF